MANKPSDGNESKRICAVIPESPIDKSRRVATNKIKAIKLSKSPKPSKSPWLGIRWLLAESLAKVILIIGALTSATGGFKGIPILLSLYPFNLLAIPQTLISIICWFTAISGFTSFYSGYNESLLDSCYDLIDWLKEKFTGWFSPKNANRFTVRPKKTHEQIKEKSDRLIQQIANNKSLHKALSKKIEDNLHLISERKLLELTRKLNSLHNDLHPENQVTSLSNQKKKLSFLDILRNIWHIFVKIVSVALIIFGSLVVVGLGILTNQSFLAYMGIVSGGLAIALCVIAAVLKQVCQLSFNCSKQDDIFRSFFRTKLSKKALNALELETLNDKLSVQDRISTDLSIVEKDTNFYSDIQSGLTNMQTIMYQREQFINSCFKSNNPVAPAERDTIETYNQELQYNLTERTHAVFDFLKAR